MHRYAIYLMCQYCVTNNRIFSNEKKKKNVYSDSILCWPLFIQVKRRIIRMIRDKCCHFVY